MRRITIFKMEIMSGKIQMPFSFHPDFLLQLRFRSVTELKKCNLTIVVNIKRWKRIEFRTKILYVYGFKQTLTHLQMPRCCEYRLATVIAHHSLVWLLIHKKITVLNNRDAILSNTLHRITIDNAYTFVNSNEIYTRLCLSNDAARSITGIEYNDNLTLRLTWWE